jgi:hypothetical protein
MAGYATAMRIERIEIRAGLAARPGGGHCEPVEQAQAVPEIELVGIEPGSRLQERLERIRIYLGQLTWYLFNAEGWR